ncbi:MAG: pyruvate dehydrogenase complex dihydrolipoamide acetyltransferase [Weeksellaceae bacterium]
MAEIIKMPRLSDTMEEGKVEAWHKKVGDKIAYGDIIAEIETDKAVQEFESDIDGTLLYIGVEEGNAAPVDSVLAIIGEEGEDISALLEGGESSNKEKEKDAEEDKEEEEKIDEEHDVQNTDEAVSATIPDDVHVVSMPRLSDTMEEGKVEAWHKKVGDKVAFGDILAEIETDKAVQEFEIDVDGTLLYIGVEEGNAAPVDSILAIIGPEGTDVSGIVASGGKQPKPKKEEKPATVAEKKDSKAAEEPKKEPASKEKQNKSGRIFISPLAKKLAEEKGYDIEDIQGSGDNGRIIKRDVESYTPSAKSAQSSTSTSKDVAVQSFAAGEEQRVPNSQMRKTIAKRLSESKFTAPHYYLNIEVDMENAMAARKQINAIPDTKISFNDIIVKAVAMALRKHPQVNSTWDDKEMILHGDINIGVAVAVPDGLMVPVLNHADQKSLTQISAEVKDLAGKARERKIKPEEMQGSTFTVSNLGAYGIESFTSIINQPNSCILSVGAIVEKPVVKNGQIVVGHTMMLSMACDHRTVDGATGSLYLQTLKQYLETPMAMFL